VGVADAGVLFGVFDGGFDAPAGGVAGDQVGGVAVQVGADQGVVVAGFGDRAGVAHEYHADGAAAVDAVPQADDGGEVDGAGFAVAGHGGLLPGRGGGQV